MLAEIDLIAEGMPVVRDVARRIARRLGGHVPLDDLIGIGNLALLEVARTYDPGRSSFESYVGSRVKWMIFDGLRRETHGRSTAARICALMASERFGEAFSAAEPEGPTTLEEDQAALTQLVGGHATAMVVGLVAGLRDLSKFAEGIDTPEEQLASAEGDAHLRGLVAALPQRERALVERHFWGGERFDVIARDLGISKSWASRMHKDAMLTLRDALQKQSAG